MRLSARWRQPLFAAIMSLGMALFMSGVITAINTGFGAGYAARWMHAFTLAFPVALAATYVWTPVTQWLVNALIKPSNQA